MARHHSYKGRFIAAAILIGLGVLFLLSNLGILHIGDILSDYWPLIFVGIGISQLTTERKPDYGGAFFFIGIGVLFLAWNLDFIGGNIIDYWPVILILLGIRILTASKREKTKFRHHQPEIHSDDPETGKPLHDKDGLVEIVTIFGGTERPVESGNFKGGEITSIFSGTTLDLRNVVPASSEISLDITAVFSGVDLIIPQNWTLDTGITPVFGSVEDKRRAMPQTQPSEVRLVLTGNCVFSGTRCANTQRPKARSTLFPWPVPSAQKKSRSSKRSWRGAIKPACACLSFRATWSSTLRKPQPLPATRASH